jgi:hypothetical protein
LLTNVKALTGLWRAGYRAAYAQLHNASRIERDTLPEVPDARADLAKKLAALASSQPPGQVMQRMVGQVPQEQQQQLAVIVAEAGVAIA